MVDEGILSKRRGTTKSNGSKNVLDKFYTKPEVARKLIDLICIDDYDLVIEPSAGSGAFSKNIPGCRAYDLEPEDDSIIKADWFLLDKSQFSDYKKILIIGNPPFGTSGNLALRFIIEAATFANTIAFILPKSFKKESIKNRIPLYFHLVMEKDLDKNSFTLEGKDYSVPCVYQVWEKKDYSREIFSGNKMVSSFIEFCDKGEADFRVQRVGGKAGKASKDLDRAVSSNYFVKNISNLETDDLISFINECVFPTIDDIVGPRSLSKKELIEVLENSIKLL